MCHSNAQCFAGEAIKCQVNINMALRNSFSYQCRIISRCVTRNLSGSQCNLRMKEAGRTHESLKSVKADMFTTLVLPPCSSPQQHSCARENPGGRSQQTCRACATSNQAFVDAIIARKQAPFHCVFVTQVFHLNIRSKRHRFSAFWLISSVVRRSFRDT